MQQESDRFCTGLIKKIKRNWEKDWDDVPVEAIELGEDSLSDAIISLLNQCLQWESVPEA